MLPEVPVVEPQGGGLPPKGYVDSDSGYVVREKLWEEDPKGMGRVVAAAGTGSNARSSQGMHAHTRTHMHTFSEKKRAGRPSGWLPEIQGPGKKNWGCWGGHRAQGPRWASWGGPTHVGEGLARDKGRGLLPGHRPSSPHPSRLVPGAGQEDGEKMSPFPGPGATLTSRKQPSRNWGGQLPPPPLQTLPGNPPLVLPPCPIAGVPSVGQA